MNRDEQMIFNNFQAMRRITEVRDEPLTPELVCEIHRIVTEGTLEDPAMAGRLQQEQTDRIAIYDAQNEVLHVPPPVDELPERLRALCEFANDSSEDAAYIPPVLRAMAVHFMLAYDHPFVDGNGRTARALFYWSMLNQGYWLTEFLSISRILKAAPSKYAWSFLYTEQDQGDLTYFFIYHLEVVQRAITELHEYLARKMREMREFQRSLAFLPGDVTVEKARQDLLALQKRGLLDRIRVGKAYTWVPAQRIAEKLARAPR
jgi:Fic family protein